MADSFAQFPKFLKYYYPLLLKKFLWTLESAEIVTRSFHFPLLDFNFTFIIYPFCTSIYGILLSVFNPFIFVCLTFFSQFSVTYVVSFFSCRLCSSNVLISPFLSDFESGANVFDDLSKTSSTKESVECVTVDELAKLFIRLKWLETFCGANGLLPVQTLIFWKGVLNSKSNN